MKKNISGELLQMENDYVVRNWRKYVAMIWW